MNRRRPRGPRLAAAALLAALTAAGCGSLLPGQARSYYLLQDLRADEVRPATVATRDPRRQRSAPAMLISVNPSSALYESAGIVFSRGPVERAYYQLATWTERPSRRLGLMAERRLVTAISAGMPLSGVALDTSGVRGDWLLSLRLIELYHDTTTQPDQAVVSVEVELVDWDRRRMLDRAVFSTATPLQAEQIDGAVAGLNQGLTTVLDQLERWVDAKARAPRPSPP